MTDPNWHPAQVQEARRLLCEAVDALVAALSYQGRSQTNIQDERVVPAWLKTSERSCNRAAEVLWLKWEDADDT